MAEERAVAPDPPPGHQQARGDSTVAAECAKDDGDGGSEAETTLPVGIAGDETRTVAERRDEHERDGKMRGRAVQLRPDGGIEDHGFSV